MFLNLEDKELKFVLENNYIGYLGYIYQNRPYVVPITYYYDKESNSIICYSGEGHKIAAMRKNNDVSLQITDIKSVTQWKSVLLHGTFKQYLGSDAKAQLHKFCLGVKEIILEKEQRKVDFISEFSSKIYSDPIVFSINIESITGIQTLQKTFAL